MLSLLASLAFVAAVCLAAIVVKATWSEYRDSALGNIAALRVTGEQRDFRVSIVALGRKPALAGNPGVRRLPLRAQSGRVSLKPATAPRRVAA